MLKNILRRFIVYLFFSEKGCYLHFYIFNFLLFYSDTNYQDKRFNNLYKTDHTASSITFRINIFKFKIPEIAATNN